MVATTNDQNLKFIGESPHAAGGPKAIQVAVIGVPVAINDDADEANGSTSQRIQRTRSRAA